MSVMILDAGNSIIKAKIARRENGEIAFPHAMKQLTESEYAKITNRAGIQSNDLPPKTDPSRMRGSVEKEAENAKRKKIRPRTNHHQIA